MQKLYEIAAVRATLEDAAERVDSFGVEYIVRNNRRLAYLNRGDTYDATIMQEESGPLFVGSWGDWLESVDEEHQEESGEITCGYCGEYTPADTDEWRDTVCEHCNRYAATGVRADDC